MADVDSPPKKKSRPSFEPEEEEEGGFKFTKQSRRTRGLKRSLDKNVSRSAKKRRSSFVRGRKERKSLARPTAGGDHKLDLYKDIPTELPPTGRLRKLFDASLQGREYIAITGSPSIVLVNIQRFICRLYNKVIFTLAIAKLTETPSSMDADLLDTEIEAKEIFEHLRHLVSETDTIDEACRPPMQKEMIKLLPNPENKQLEKSAVTCKLATQRLQKEDSKWNNLLLEKKNMEEQTKQELQEYMRTSGSKEECPDFLSPSQHKLLSGKPAFKSFSEQRENLKQTTSLQVDKICQVINGLSQYQKVAEGYLNKQMGSFGAKVLDEINDIGTPRTLIRGHLTGH